MKEVANKGEACSLAFFALNMPVARREREAEDVGEVKWKRKEKGERYWRNAGSRAGVRRMETCECLLQSLYGFHR